MRTRIKTIQINGKTKAIKEWRMPWGETFASVLAISETPEHAKCCVCKVTAFKRNHQSIEDIAKANRKVAFMAMPRREYKQVYIR